MTPGEYIRPSGLVIPSGFTIKAVNIHFAGGRQQLPLQKYELRHRSFHTCQITNTDLLKEELLCSLVENPNRFLINHCHARVAVT